MKVKIKKEIKKDNPSDMVSRGAFEQVRWERDVAFRELEELGIPFGVVATDYAKPIIHAHWISDGVWDICSNCHGQHVQPHIKGLPTHLYCPYCGATMDEETDSNELSLR